MLVVAGLTVVAAVPAYATSSSQNYKIVEQEFGAGSSSETCSGSYCARTSIGDLAVGKSTAPQTAAEFGSITPDGPLIEVIVDPGESNLGELTTEQTAFKTMTVRVRTYVSNGYYLQITGKPPTYGRHTLATPSSPVASSPGTEQFAINAVANTEPSVGENPVQVPSNEFSFGELEDNYKQPNKYMYKSGDTVARSQTESGRTDYTISMIVNISSGTPAGNYSGDFSAVVIPMF